ncbi:hypothetical protein CRG98_037262 [Punica granatum]|uniref:Uncharacterized protein n=1 Tax=Punica granatum TaxID=22663 RepID=A0A2I0IEX0_PUNGR|nr:hypothetical protein CRG98_037262 [Punica granatum]
MDCFGTPGRNRLAREARDGCSKLALAFSTPKGLLEVVVKSWKHAEARANPETQRKNRLVEVGLSRVAVSEKRLSFRAKTALFWAEEGLDDF